MNYIVIIGPLKSPNLVIDKLSLVVTRMTANANFTTPAPPLSELTAIRDEIIILKNEIAALKEEVQEKEEEMELKLVAARNLIQAEANYVQALIRSTGTSTLASSAGFDLQSAPTSTPLVLSQPQNVRLNEYKKLTGKLQLLFNPVDKAKSYKIIYTYDISDPNGWSANEPIIVTSSVNIILTLAAGRTVWVKIKAIGSGGSESGYSDVATRVVP